METLRRMVSENARGDDLHDAIEAGPLGGSSGGGDIPTGAITSGPDAAVEGGLEGGSAQG